MVSAYSFARKSAELKIIKSSDEQQRRALVTQLLHEEFLSLHPLWVERHLALLTNLRHMFGNDLDKPIILAVIGQFMFENAVDMGKRYGDHLDEAQQARPVRLTNVESVATSAGLPRESVRRKVGELIDIGWMARDEKRGLLITTDASNALDGTTQQAFRLLTDMFLAMMAALEERGEAQFIQTSDASR